MNETKEVEQSIVLDADGLSKQYQTGEIVVNALNDVSFRVASGEFVAIMGPSGSGKSTLLHLMGGLDDPSGGTITLAGSTFSNQKDTVLTLARRHHIGFIFQFFNLIPTLNAEENILLPVIIDGKDPRKYQDRLDQLLGLVNLTKRRQHKPDQLSGGEQQRVAIARALITEPAVVLADEPTGNLDSKSGRLVMELLRQSCDELNQSIVIVTHDSRAAAYADRVVFLRDGKIEQEMLFFDETPALRMQKINAALETQEAQA